MELFCELLLTAAVTLLAAFLLATLVAANDPLRRADRAAAAIAEEVLEVERTIEVDEARRGQGSAPAEAEGWVEVEQAPAVAVEEVQELECLPEEEVPVKAAREVRLGARVGELEEGGDGVTRRDLTPAAAATSPPASGADEAAPREVIGVAGLEEGSVQDVEVKQHDLGAEVAPIEVLEAGSESQGVEVAEASPQVVEVAEVFPLETESVQVKQHRLLAEVTPAEDVLDAGLAGKSVQAIQTSPDELDTVTAPEEMETEDVQVKQHHLVAEVTPAEDVLDEGLAGKSVQPIQARPDESDSTAPEEILDVALERKEEQLVEVKGRELPAKAAAQPLLVVPLAETEELEDHHHPVEEAVNVHEEVQSKEEAKCEAHPVDQQEELVPKEEPVARKTDDVNVSHEGSSSDKVVTELPVEAGTFQGLPEGHTESDMDFEEWEGIERSEVEKRFGAAAAFAASGAGAAALSKLDSDVQLQLQGLLKVAIDGPCYDSTQPLTLRPSSRAKWVAWQKLGNMHPEIAMEKYMNLLSETIPGWTGNETSDTKKDDLTMTATSVQRNNQGNEDSTSIDDGTSPNPEKGQSSDVFAE